MNETEALLKELLKKREENYKRLSKECLTLNSQLSKENERDVSRMADVNKTIDAFAFWVENEERGVCYIPLNLCEKVLKLLKEQDSLVEDAREQGYSDGYNEREREYQEDM